MKKGVLFIHCERTTIVLLTRYATNESMVFIGIDWEDVRNLIDLMTQVTKPAQKLKACSCYEGLTTLLKSTFIIVRRTHEAK